MEYIQRQPEYIDNEILNKDITLQEVKEVINKAKCSKSPGIDNLPYEVYKNDSVTLVLTQLFQKCLERNRIPSIWSSAIIQPIPKSKDKDNRVPLNYRGISLLCCAAKLYSAVLSNRLTSFFTANHTIVEEQNGFRKNRTCTDHVFTLNTIIKNRMEDGLDTFTAFIDLKKVFDSVNSRFMEAKLLDVGVDGNLYTAIKTFISCNKACVRLNAYHTEWFTTGQGLRQGDSLSPNLFSLFINDLAQVIKTVNKGVDINGLNVSILLYADDIVLIAPTAENLQVMLDTMNEWTTKWHMRINDSKSKIVHFRKPHKNRAEYVYRVGNVKLNYVTSYKYLGVVFDENLNFKENACLLAQSGNRALGSLVAKYKKNVFIGFNSYTKLYEACVCPVVDYSSAVWGYHAYKEIDSVQQKAQRIFLGVHKFAPLLALEGDTGWLSAQYRRWVNIIRFWNRMIIAPPNSLTKQMFEYDYNKCEQGRNNWCANVKKLFRQVNLQDNYINKDTCDLRKIKKLLFEEQEKTWKEKVINKPKLRFYCLFKSDLLMENYVTYNLSPSERSMLAQFRMGILPLEIETGRFFNVKVEERICKLCTEGLVEDEYHFLFVCPLYEDLREDMFSEITNICPEFVYLEYAEQLNLLFKEFCRKVAKYIKRAYERRKSVLYT